jgi:hypothetical protein
MAKSTASSASKVFQTSTSGQLMRRVIPLLGIATCATIFLGGCTKPVETRLPSPVLLTEAPLQAGLAREAPIPGATMPHSLFVSGHSLTTRPLPDYLAAFADRTGTPLRWGLQELSGTSVRERSPAPITADKFDALLITEMHSVLQTFLWNDTERHLREYHDAFLAANPTSTTYFYVPWISMIDKYNPRDWIAYEKAAAPVWQCMVTRVNARIAAAGRADRIVTIPASLAMVFLVERIQSDSALPGVDTGGASRPIDLFLTDTVHLTPLGFFYVALVNYLALSGADPASLEPLLREPVVPAVSPEQAQTLLKVAAEFLAIRAANSTALDAAGCRQFLEQSFIDDYWAYTYRQLRTQMGATRAQLKLWHWKWLFAKYFRSW